MHQTEREMLLWLVGEGPSPIRAAATLGRRVERAPDSQSPAPDTFWLPGSVRGRQQRLLQLHGRSMLHDLNDPALAPLVFEYAEAILDAGRIVAVPDELRGHVYERFLAPPDTDWAPLSDHQESDTLDGLEQVCVMDVDPARTRYSVEYGGRTVVFCAPACKKQFVADPSAYLSA